MRINLKRRPDLDRKDPPSEAWEFVGFHDRDHSAEYLERVDTMEMRPESSHVHFLPIAAIADRRRYYGIDEPDPDGRPLEPDADKDDLARQCLIYEGAIPAARAFGYGEVEVPAEVARLLKARHGDDYASLG